MDTMKAVVFKGKDRIAVEEVPKPDAACRRGRHPRHGDDDLRNRRAHRPRRVSGQAGPDSRPRAGRRHRRARRGLDEFYTVGQRVIVGAITPCGQCFYCLNGTIRSAAAASADGGSATRSTARGRSICSCRTRARTSRPFPTDLTDEDVLLCPDIFSTGLSGAESGNIRVGDAVAVFAQGPIGLCATVGAKLKGASLIIGVDSNQRAARQSRASFGANVTLNTKDGDPVAEIKRLTDGRGVDVAIEALGRQETFENALRSIRPGGTLSSLGVYSGKLVAPYEAFYAGLGDQKIVTTLCPGGKERMRRLMAMIEHRRVDLSPLVTHKFALDDIEAAFDLFSHQRDGVLKVALYPDPARATAPRETVGAYAMDEQC